MNATIENLTSSIKDRGLSVNFIPEGWAVMDEEQTYAEEVPSATFVKTVELSAGTALHQIGSNILAGYSPGLTSIEVEGQELADHRFFYWVSNAIIFVDPPNEGSVSDSEFSPAYEQVIDSLRNGGREILADEVVDILRNSQEDPEEPDINVISLQAMARFLVSHRTFEDPIVGPDPGGLMQIEWHIDGNGLLVLAFLDQDRIHCIVQADETPPRLALNESAILTEEQALKDFGHLVPTL